MKTDIVIRTLGTDLACFIPRRRLSELQRAVQALRASNHPVRVERARCNLSGCVLHGYNLLIAPEHEAALIAALPSP